MKLDSGFAKHISHKNTQLAGGEALRMENRTEPQNPLEIVVMRQKMQLKVMKSRKLQSNTNGKNALRVVVRNSKASPFSVPG